MPELPFNDVPAAVRHYRDVLGFSVNYEQDDLGVMDRDEVRLEQPGVDLPARGSPFGAVTG